MRPPIILLSLLVYSGAVRNPNEDDEAFNPGVDVVGDTGTLHVPFGHIFKEGYDDPFSDLKRPIDVLEMSLKTPRSKAERDRLLKEAPPGHILKVDKKRYEMYNEKEDIRKAKVEITTAKPPQEGPRWIDFGSLNAQYLSSPPPLRPVPRPESPRSITKFNVQKPPPMTNANRDMFGLKFPNPFKETVWTNCTEFAKKSESFHPKDIVDIDWTPFYIWSNRRFRTAALHRFSYPTKKIVKEYKTLYSSHIKKSNLDWEQPKLILKESIEMLLIADVKDRRGLFHGVPKRPLPKDPKTLELIDFSVPLIRIKIVDPYLAMMYCDNYYAIIMAAPGTEPLNEQEKEEEAKLLNFTGIGFPVIRDVEAELAAMRSEMQRQRDAEETKYIKAYNVGGKMDFLGMG